MIYNDPNLPTHEVKIPDINRYLDSTILKPVTSPDQICTLCEGAVRYGFRSVRVPPSFVYQAYDIIRNQLQNKSVLIGTVISFPFGYDTVQSKRSTIAELVSAGADECDVVLSHTIKMGGYIFEELGQYESFSHKVNIIPILEVSHFDSMPDQLIKLISQIENMNFIKVLKTSTGVNVRATLPDDVKRIKNNFGDRFIIKASGGISNFDSAFSMIKAGASIIGTSGAESIAIEHSIIKKKFDKDTDPVLKLIDSKLE
jgi:deoxyribose-phosphate aldolase